MRGGIALLKGMLVVGVELSDHAGLRGARQNLSDTDIDLIMLHGHLEQRAGVRFYQLRFKDIPRDTPASSRLWQLVGSTVMFSKSGPYVVTLYRNPRAFRRDRRKDKFNRKEAYA